MVLLTLIHWKPEWDIQISQNAKFHQKPIPVSLILNLDMVTVSCLFIFIFVCLVTSLKKVDHHVTRRDLQVLMQSMDCSNDPKR